MKILNNFIIAFKTLLAKYEINRMFLPSSIKEKRVILVGSPLHGNLGDHAISIAERQLLDSLENFELIEIPGDYYRRCQREIKELINENDVILITGGGFIGTLWKNEHDLVESILRDFSQNRIIIMPQTFYFSDDEYGKLLISNFKDILAKQRDAYIFLRDKASYDLCKKEFATLINIKLVPDIVLYLDLSEPTCKREGALFCFREDKERVLSESQISKIEAAIKKRGIRVKYTSTVLNHNVSLKNRKSLFFSKLSEFKKSEIVFTDRLHGMIFSVITSTPCIAFDNSSRKVQGVYEWVKDLEYIDFAKDISDIETLIKTKSINKKYTYTVHSEISEKYSEIIKAITG